MATKPKLSPAQRLAAEHVVIQESGSGHDVILFSQREQFGFAVGHWAPIGWWSTRAQAEEFRARVARILTELLEMKEGT